MVLLGIVTNYLSLTGPSSEGKDGVRMDSSSGIKKLKMKYRRRVKEWDRPISTFHT